jgi:hypothetical protein
MSKLAMNSTHFDYIKTMTFGNSQLGWQGVWMLEAIFDAIPSIRLFFPFRFDHFPPFVFHNH